MQESERKALIAALRDQTEFGRLNASVIEAGFAKIEELGFQIVRKEEPKPVVVATPEPEPVAAGQHPKAAMAPASKPNVVTKRK